MLFSNQSIGLVWRLFCMDWFGKSVFFNKENEKLFKFEKSLFSNEIYKLRDILSKVRSVNKSNG